MKKHHFLKFAAMTTLVVVTATQVQSQQEAAKMDTLTPNMQAANGPIPGDLSLYEKELAEAAKGTSPGYYPSLGAAEISGATRSGFFPAASFTGSFDEKNQVYAWRSEDRYQGLTYIVNRKPGELYLLGGDYPPPAGPLPPGPYVAKADATTGKQIWRAYLSNGNVSGGWIANASLNILDNGNIPIAWSNQIVLVDGDSGRILKHNTLPVGNAPADDVNYKHLTIAPDRTLILKCQTRPTGEKAQGTMAIFQGLMKGLKQPSSHLCAVDPDTLEILDHIPLPEPSSSPHIIDKLGNKIAIYVPLNSGMMRVFWNSDAKKLAHLARFRRTGLFPDDRGFHHFASSAGSLKTCWNTDARTLTHCSVISLSLRHALEVVFD